jgi:hypothetical protein
VFLYVFWDWFFYFHEEYHWNFDRHCVEYVDYFGLYGHFSQCWFYQSKSMEDISIFWCLLWFLSSVVYSFYWKYLWFTALNLVQYTLLFLRLL